MCSNDTKDNVKYKSEQSVLINMNLSTQGLDKFNLDIL